MTSLSEFMKNPESYEKETTYKIQVKGDGVYVKTNGWVDVRAHREKVGSLDSSLGRGEKFDGFSSYDEASQMLNTMNKSKSSKYRIVEE